MGKKRGKESDDVTRAIVWLSAHSWGKRIARQLGEGGEEMSPEQRLHLISSIHMLMQVSGRRQGEISVACEDEHDMASWSALGADLDD